MPDAASKLFDEYLAASARTGSRVAMERLAERFHSRLCSHARRLTGDGDAARDIAQEAWIEIVRGLPRLDDARAFPAWAFRIVSRRAAGWVRGQQRRRKMTADLTAQPSPPAPPDPMEHAVDAGGLSRAIAALPPEQQAAIALFYLEDMSVVEIAVALAVPAGTVKTRLMHAREKLRQTLLIKEKADERTR